MSTPSILLLVLAIQHLLYGLAWWVGASLLRLPRPAALHWAGFCAAVSAAATLFALPVPALGPALAPVRNLLVLVACLLLRRGVACFFQQDPQDRELALLLAAATVGTLAAGGDPEGLLARSLVLSAAMGWVLLRLAFELLSALAPAQGRRVAWALAAPALVVGALFPLRALMGLTGGLPVGELSIQVGSEANQLSVLSLVVLSTAFQFSLLYLVMQRLVARLRELSRHDPLTGLLNRRAWEAALAAQRLQLRRRPACTALLVTDLDHFKRLNDQLGHAAGDAALVAVARALQSVMRETDVVARLGGEEFGVLLPDTDVAGAAMAAERVREAVAQLQIERAGHPVPLTVSVGAAVLPPQREDGAMSLQDLLARADAALYQAKAEGRNRVVVDTPPALSHVRVA